MRGRVKFPLTIKPGGVREDLGPTESAEGTLLSSSNWLTRNGVGRPRPGYAIVASQLAAANRVTGIGFRGSVETAARLVVHTLTKAYAYDGSAFSDKTGTWTTSTAAQPVRFTAFPKSGTTYLLRVNAANAVDVYDGGAGNFTDAGGSPPRARDIATVGNRVVLFNITDGSGNYPSRVQWCNFNDFDVWTATDIAELGDTPGDIIGGRAFGPLSMGVYKDDSVWLGIAQVAKAAFQFQFIQEVAGPVSPGAIVAWRGAHYWLAKNGVLYRFDGSSVKEVGIGLSTTALTTLHYDRRMETHGCVLPLPQPELWFFYPVAGSVAINRAISMNLVTGAINPHTFTDSISASAGWLSQQELTWDTLTGTWDTLVYPTWDSMGTSAQPTAILGDSVGKMYQFGIAATDNGTAIPWSFEHGWKTPAGLGKRLYLDGIASYWQKATQALTVTVTVTVTDTLGDADTTQTDTFDLSTDSNHLKTFPNTVGQWVKVKHSATSQVGGMEHRGAAILGWEQAMV